MKCNPSGGPCQYTDESGQVHLVDSINEVPAAYVGRAETVKGKLDVSPVGAPSLLDQVELGPSVAAPIAHLQHEVFGGRGPGALHLPSVAVGVVAGLAVLWLSRRLWRWRRNPLVRMGLRALSMSAIAAAVLFGYLSMTRLVVGGAASGIATSGGGGASGVPALPLNPLEAARQAREAAERHLGEQQKALQQIEAAEH